VQWTEPCKQNPIHAVKLSVCDTSKSGLTRLMSKVTDLSRRSWFGGCWVMVLLLVDGVGVRKGWGCKLRRWAGARMYVTLSRVSNGLNVITSHGANMGKGRMCFESMIDIGQDNICTGNCNSYSYRLSSSKHRENPEKPCQFPIFQ
jgi:hypothetical protein